MDKIETDDEGPGFPYVITHDDGHNYPRRFLVEDATDVRELCERYAGSEELDPSQPGYTQADEAYDALCIGSPDYSGEWYGTGDRLYVEAGDPPTRWKDISGRK